MAARAPLGTSVVTVGPRGFSGTPWGKKDQSGNPQTEQREIKEE